MLPLDLHVLGLPLAFILSQDQTLHCIMNLPLGPRLLAFGLLLETLGAPYRANVFDILALTQSEP